jgi:CheY-like chemotaxis protein
MEAPKLILAVDDEFIILESLRIQLERNFGVDYILEFADCAESGLEILTEAFSENKKLSLVITDWMMPGMKGDEFARTIRTNYPETKIIMLTGQVDQNVLQKVLEDNVVDKVISKPWSEFQIRENAQELLDA